MRVAVLGASPKPERFSNQAVRALSAHGHTVIPVNPAHPIIEELKVAPSLRDIETPVHTVTVYIGPKQMDEALIEDIVSLKPERVILNPGAESPALIARLEKENVPCVQECTLVMLQLRRF